MAKPEPTSLSYLDSLYAVIHILEEWLSITFTLSYRLASFYHLFNCYTRMLAINVSIPNLTVARLEQFRTPQLRIQRDRPTDAGFTENKPSFIPNPHVIISLSHYPFAANVVPKLVSMATSLRPSIKQRVSGYDTTEVIPH